MPSPYFGGSAIFQLEFAHSPCNFARTSSWEAFNAEWSRAVAVMSLHVRQQSSNPIVSDYESDAIHLPDIPPPADRTPDELNLSVLRRHDSAVTAVQYVAPYVVVYRFSQESQGWDKSGVEGTAFICRLRPTATRPFHFAVMVLNRRGLDNFRLEVTSDASVEVSQDIVMFHSESNDQIHGFWVYSEPEPSSTSRHREKFAQTIKQCARKMEQATTDGAPMSRQLSLKQIFGQQRQQDDSWSVRSHSPQDPAPQFMTTADTEFFRSSKGHADPPDPSHTASLLSMLRGAGTSPLG